MRKHYIEKVCPECGCCIFGTCMCYEYDDNIFCSKDCLKTWMEEHEDHQIFSGIPMEYCEPCDFCDNVVCSGDEFYELDDELLCSLNCLIDRMLNKAYISHDLLNVIIDEMDTIDI